MGTILFLILFPLAAAAALLLIKTDGAREWMVKGSSAVIAIASIFLAVQYYGVDGEFFVLESKVIEYAIVGIEVLLGLLIFYLGIRYKKYLAPLIALVQTPLLVWFELTIGQRIPVTNNLYIDRFSVIMVLIIGIIGTLICVYSLGYMKEFHHHQEQEDRRPWFFFLLFVFLSAMFGIVTSNNLVWMLLFWDITTLCSFFLIGYTKTKEAIHNSFRALVINLTGGLAFTLAILALGSFYGTLELNQMLAIGTMGYSVVLPAALLAFAGITKAAQMPFSSWLLGVTAAPAPTAALLHSSTMVKAGVFLMVKLAPVMGWNIAGIMTSMIGGVTFLVASFLAISQTDAKRVLSYSTVSNLGLIVACGGIGTPGAVWAAIMLLLFHAIAKSLLFLCVGTAERQIGSGEIQDLDGLFGRMPRIAQYMAIGISGMFLAPFGMLLSKWIALKAFVDSGNPILVMVLVFGSAATLYFWTKWLGKIIAIIANPMDLEETESGSERLILSFLAAVTAALSVLFPLIATYLIVPYLQAVYQMEIAYELSATNLYLMSLLMAVLVLLFTFSFRKAKKSTEPICLSDLEQGEEALIEWDLAGFFGEKKMDLIGVICCSTIIVLAFLFLLGGAF